MIAWLEFQPGPVPKRPITIDELCGQPKGSFKKFVEENHDPDAYAMQCCDCDICRLEREAIERSRQ